MAANIVLTAYQALRFFLHEPQVEISANEEGRGTRGVYCPDSLVTGRILASNFF